MALAPATTSVGETNVLAVVKVGGRMGDETGSPKRRACFV